MKSLIICIFSVFLFSCGHSSSYVAKESKQTSILGYESYIEKGSHVNEKGVEDMMFFFRDYLDRRGIYTKEKIDYAFNVSAKKYKFVARKGIFDCSYSKTNQCKGMVKYPEKDKKGLLVISAPKECLMTRFSLFHELLHLMHYEIDKVSTGNHVYKNHFIQGCVDENEKSREQNLDCLKATLLGNILNDSGDLKCVKR